MAEPCFAPIGTFGWPELASGDLAASKAFFAGLLGWAAQDVPTAMGNYTIFQFDGLDAAGGYPNGADQGPPRFNSYLMVDDADDAAARAKALGGTVIMAPFDVEGVGRMAFLQDPTGAVFAVFQSKGHGGTGLLGAPGGLCWTELATHDPDQALAFYTGLFGWQAKTSTIDGMTYTEFSTGEQPFAGMLKPDWPGADQVPSFWAPYFSVQDVDAAAAKAKALGGTVCVEPRDIEGVGRFTVLQEPSGAMFNLIQLAAPA
jgi:hypothetical protein